MSKKKPQTEKCDVTRDLMPLCVDGAASEATQRRVHKHVEDCPACAEIYRDMQTRIEPTSPDDGEAEQFDSAVKKIQHRHARRRLGSILLGVLLALVVCAAAAYGYWWYFVEEVPVPVDTYKVALRMRTTSTKGTVPLILRVKDFPSEARLHVDVAPDGMHMDDQGATEQNYAVHVWAGAPRAADLTQRSERSYYAFSMLTQEKLFVVQGTPIRADNVYQGREGGETAVVYAAGINGLNRILTTTGDGQILYQVDHLSVELAPGAEPPVLTPAPTVTALPLS